MFHMEQKTQKEEVEMRLGKRIGFIGLTLMLAASLLTGCGDNNTPPSGNDALSKPGQSNSGTENTGSSSSSTGSGSTEDKTDTPTSSKGGRAVKYFNRRDKMTQFDYKVVTDEGGYMTGHSTLHVVTDGNRWMERLTGGEGDGAYDSITVTDIKEKAIYRFTGKEGSEVYRRQPADTDLSMRKATVMRDDIRKWKDYPMTVGTCMVDGVLYYSETYYDLPSKGTSVYCFDMNDLEGTQLRYVLEQFENVGETTTTIKRKYVTDTTKINYADLQIPEGRYLANVNDRNQPDEKTPKDNYPN